MTQHFDAVGAVRDGDEALLLSEQDKKMMEQLYDDAMRTAAYHYRRFAAKPCLRQLFFDLVMWHRRIVQLHRFNHMTIDYDVKVHDNRQLHVLLNKALFATSMKQVNPPELHRPAEADMAVDSPYRAFITTYPHLTGYMMSEGLSVMLRKVWIFLDEIYHTYRGNAVFYVETLGRFNADIECEIRIGSGRHLNG